MAQMVIIYLLLVSGGNIINNKGGNFKNEILLFFGGGWGVSPNLNNMLSIQWSRPKQKGIGGLIMVILIKTEEGS